MANYNLFDAASLVMVPSGVKEDKLYSIKPTDGSGDFTFSRGSDIQATRVNSSGLIEKAKVNLILQSNQFDTTWFLNGAPPLTGGQADKDGGTDAWLLENTGTQYASVRQTISNTGVVSLSVYAKAGTLDYLAMNAGGSLTTAWFDLANGTTGSINTNVIDSAIESVGGGWYRCSMSIVGITEFRIYVTDADNNFGTATGNIYIQDAQLNHGLVAQDYVETTTTSVVEGLTADLPRLDYSGGASCPSLLLEPSRTNLIPHSEYIGDIGWTKSNATITTNHAISAEGAQNASLVTFSSGGYILEFINTTKTIGSTETISVFSNADISGTFLKYGGGTTAGTDVEGREVIGNGWYRYYVTRTFTEAATGSTQFVIAQSNVGDSVLIYGAQLEVGSYPTSYIPTYGAAANRGVDDAILNNSSALPTALPFTMYVKTNVEDRSSEQMFISLYDSSTSSRYANLSHTNGVWSAQFRPMGTFVVANYTQSITRPDNKVAMVVTDTELKLFLNGALVKTTTNNQPFNTNMTDLLLGRLRVVADTGTRDNVAEALMFKTALTDAECIALTTI